MDNRRVMWFFAHLPQITATVTLLLVLAIGAAFAILIPLSGKVAEQAREGAHARATQCDREPVIAKVGEAAYAVRHALPKDSRITKRELRLFERNAPHGCPK